LAWTIEYDEGAVKDLKKLDHQVQHEILGFLEKRIGQAKDPRSFGKPQHHLRRLISPPSRMAFHSGGLQPAILLLPDVCSGEFISPSFLSL
jgi:hypothetical protein